MRIATSSILFVTLLKGALGSTPPAASATSFQVPPTAYPSQPPNVTVTWNATAFPTPTANYTCIIYPTGNSPNATTWTIDIISGNGTYPGKPSPTAHHENWGNGTATTIFAYPSGDCIPYYPNGTANATVTATATATFIGNNTAPISAPTNNTTNGTNPQNLNGGDDKPKPDSAMASLNTGFSGAAVAVVVALASMI